MFIVEYFVLSVPWLRQCMISTTGLRFSVAVPSGGIASELSDNTVKSDIDRWQSGWRRGGQANSECIGGKQGNHRASTIRGPCGKEDQRNWKVTMT